MAASDAQQWEYKFANFIKYGRHAGWMSREDGRTVDETEYLNELGRQGWELVACNSGRLIFKRPINRR